MDQVDVADLRVAVRRAGEGPPLVLVHGAVCDSRVWRHQLEDLSADFTIVAWDAPGCGRSADPPEGWRLAEYADCLAGLISILGLRRPHLLGHSFGGALVLEVYRRHPSIPGSLILAAGYAGWAGSLPADEVARRVQFAEQAANLQSVGGFDPVSMRGLFSDVMPADTARELAGIMADSRPLATRVMAYALAEADLNGMLPDVAVPTLLLYGDADERSRPDVAESLHVRIPGSKLVMLPGLGHESYLEAPERFDHEVRHFLRQLT